MTHNSTVDKLIEMRLGSMANHLIQQEQDHRIQDLSFDERFALLVDAEYISRKNNRLTRLIKKAEFDQPEAYVGDIDYHSGRKLNKALIQKLASCEYIVDHRNIFITGATGSGKTYMACAFGMEACKRFYTTKYIRLPDLFIELDAARQNGAYKDVLTKYAKPTLLILDEWLMLPPTESEKKDIFELLHRRRRKSSTIFCSQVDPKGWYAQLGGKKSALADAIIDRIIHDGYQINIQSLDPSKDISMREVYGIPVEFRQ